MRRLVPICLSLVLALGVQVGELRAADDQSDATFAESVAFRQNFGLAADPATVRAVNGDPANRRAEFPVPLAPAEFAEMSRRIAMEDQMAALEVASEKLPGFAGHWIDQPAGGVIRIAFVGGAERHRPALAALVPPGAQLALVDVKYTLADLEGVDARIRSDVDALIAQGINVGHYYVDVTRNKVVVGVRNPGDAVDAALTALYGDVVVTEISNPAPTGCTSRENCIGPPLRAGISGAPAGTALAYRCSIAFLVHKNAATQWLTAGHCAQTVAPSTTSPCPASYCWYHAGNSSWGIGKIYGTCWPSCNYSDAARAGNINTTYASHKVYQSGNANGVSVTVQQGYNADDIGDYVCLNARKAEAWRCGYIQSIATMCYEGDPCTLWFLEQRFANYASQYGDSGGAVHSAIITSGVRAYGVHSGCTNLVNGVCQGYGVYSHIYRIGQELGVSVCTVTNPCSGG